jgi:hypothetical protein
VEKNKVATMALQKKNFVPAQFYSWKVMHPIFFLFRQEREKNDV